MVTVTTTKHFCDCCDEEIEPDNNGMLQRESNGEFKVFFDGEWAPEVKINWKHFCRACRERLIRLVSLAKEAA